MSYMLPSRELLDMTQTMLLAAEAGDWEKVGKIEVARQVVLKRLEARIGTPEGKSSVDIVNHIQEVLSINKRIIDLGQRVKTELAEAMGGIRQGRKAVNAYYGIR